MIDKDKIMELTREFLVAIGEDPSRDGLLDTPRRVANMCDELLNCEKDNAKYIFFEAHSYDGIVLVKDIDFSSMCEHHLLPFVGKIHIAYIPNDKVIGISKFARIVDKHAKKLQIQERLAKDIIHDMQGAMNPKGIAIYIEAKHLCMNIRGITRRNASTVTTLFVGEFENYELQKIFMDIIK